MKEWFELFQTAMNSELNNSDNVNAENEDAEDQSMQTVMTNTVTTTQQLMDKNKDNDGVNKIDFGLNSGECYEFTHGFLRDAIYEQMLSTQRIRIHKSAQEYLRKILKAISFLPDYTNKEIDNRDYTLLLQRHQAITNNYQQQQKNIGPMVTEDTKKKKK